MTGTNHVLAGAVVATSVQQPLLVVPLAFLSHFVLDTLPHFGVDHTAKGRSQNILFKYVLAIDIALTSALLALLPFILRGVISWRVLLAGMVLALAPDIVWARSLIHELTTKTKYMHSHWLTKLHLKIQWFEKPFGLVIEVLWFGVMGVLLGLLAT